MRFEKCLLRFDVQRVYYSFLLTLAFYSEDTNTGSSDTFKLLSKDVMSTFCHVATTVVKSQNAHQKIKFTFQTGGLSKQKILLENPIF